MKDIHNLVLMSGGIDSSAAVGACFKGQIAPEGVFVDYG